MRDRDEVIPDIEHELAMEGHDARSATIDLKLENAKFGAEKRAAQTQAIKDAKVSADARDKQARAAAHEQLFAAITEQVSRIVALYETADWSKAQIVEQDEDPDDCDTEERGFALLQFCTLYVAEQYAKSPAHYRNLRYTGWVRSDGRIVFGRATWSLDALCRDSSLVMDLRKFLRALKKVRSNHKVYTIKISYAASKHSLRYRYF